MRKIDRIIASGNVPTAAIYARFSSDNQREESIDAQLRACREYAEQNHIKIVYEYVDRAKSATTTENRTSFLAMISNADNFDFVIVHKLDRFARNRSDSIGYRMELKRHGTTLISVLENLNEDNPESVILESVLEGMNEYYSRNLAREVRKGLNENALKCMHTGGIPPLGYDVNPKTKQLEINREESLTIKLIFQSVLDGKGYSHIIRLLNENGMKTKRGKPFGKNSLHDILRNEKYCGVYVYNRAQSKIDNKRNSHKNKADEDIIRIENGVPAIISKETFERVQEIMNRRQNKTPTSAAKETYLLSGKIFCGECGAVYCGNRHSSSNGKTTIVTYRCNNRSRRTNAACKNKEVNKKNIEAFVLNILAEIIFDEKYIPNIIGEYNDFVVNNSTDMKEAADILKKEITKKVKKIDNLSDVIAETGNASLVIALEKAENERDKLEKQLEVLNEKMRAVKIPDMEINTAFSKAKMMFQSGQLSETRQLINLYVEKVIVYPDRIDLKINPLNFVTNVLSAGNNAELNKIPSDSFTTVKSIDRKELRSE